MDLTLSLTHACDLACDYCFAGQKDGRTMSRETGQAGLRLALERARAAGQGLDVSFFGGEPLLRFELLLALADDALHEGARAGVPVRLQVTTNGTGLSPERARALDARGVHVALSVDGLPEAQDLARPAVGGAPSSPRVERGLDAALAHVRSLSTITVVEPRTVRLLARGVAHLVARGVRDLTLNPAWSADWREADLQAWETAYEQLAGQWSAAHRQGQPFVLSTIDPRVRARVLGTRNGCGAACGGDGHELAVAPSGRLYACGRSIGEDAPVEEPGRGLLGHVDRGIDPARLAALPGGAPLPAECAACAHLERCARGCACSNRESSGDPALPGAVLCWHERMSIPLADRAAAALWAERVPSFLGRFYGFAALPAARPVPAVRRRSLPVVCEVRA